MDESIKIALYNLLKSTLEGITTNGGAITVFKYVGHFNGQGINDVNNFAYDTPAVFISFDLIEWIHTKHDTPEVDITRAQSGRIRFSLHYFFHDLRTDTDSFTDHLQTIDYVYHSILGLRSDSSVLGKISSMRRVSEVDDNDNNNLREWISTYETALEETGITPGRIDAAPVALEMTIVLPEKPPPPGFIAEYQAVYDEQTIKPDATRAAIWNTFVTKAVGTGEWYLSDGIWIFSQHINTNGESQLNWRAPAGIDLMDTGKGTFDDLTTESWQPFGTNILTNVDIGDGSRALRIEIVDSSTGAQLALDQASDLISDLIDNTLYKLRIRLKIDTGSGTIRMYNKANTLYVNDSFTNTGFEWKEYLFYSDSGGTVPRIQFASLSVGEDVEIEQLEFVQFTAATLYNAPAFAIDEGFKGNALDAYIDLNFDLSLHGINYALNSGSCFAYLREISTTNNKSDLGVFDPTNDGLRLQAFKSGGLSLARVNSTSDGTGVSSQLPGAYHLNRVINTEQDLYYEKGLIFNHLRGASSLPTGNVWALAQNAVAPVHADSQISIIALTAGMNQTQRDNLRDYFHEAMTALGKNVT